MRRSIIQSYWRGEKMTEKQEKIEDFIDYMVKDLSSFYDVNPPKVAYLNTYIEGVDISGKPIMGEYVFDIHTINMSIPALEHQKTFEWYATALHEYRHFLQEMVIERITGMTRDEIYLWRDSLLDPSIIFELSARDQSFIFTSIKNMDDALEEDAEAWANAMLIKLYKQQHPEIKVEMPGYPTSLKPITDIVSPVWDKILKIKEKVKKIVYHPKLVEG